LGILAGADYSRGLFFTFACHTIDSYEIQPDYFFLTLVILLIPYGCVQDNFCLSNQHALQTGFYSAYSATQKDSTLPEATVYGLNNDSILINKKDAGKMFLPLTFDGDTTIFILETNTLADTLWVIHSKESQFISRECGYSWNFKLDTVIHTNAFIDSVAVFNRHVKYGENSENVKIYLY
jgi:hypothetical protein